MQLQIYFALLSTATQAILGCTHSTIVNGNFETGKIAPWTVSTEYLSGVPAVTTTSPGFHGSKYAANLSLIWTPKTDGAPLIDLYQYVYACGVPQSLSLWYNVQPDPVAGSDTRFNPFIYDSVTHKVYVNEFVYYNGSAGADSLGNAYGTWHELGPYHFTPSSDKLIFSLVAGNAGNTIPNHGRATILVDNVKVYNST